jgi:dienelactone hydrolase
MRVTTLFRFILLLSAGLLFIGAGPRPGPGNYEISGIEPCYNLESEEVCSEITVTGHSQGNHELDCTVIQPWIGDDPIENLPVIVWANGWGWNNNAGESTTAGYKPGLIEWALSGPYIVVAANQWSVQESDVLQCLQWVINEYEVEVDSTKIGLSGHSQGGGAIIKAGDGEPNGFDITATIPMNPYGPGWVRPGNQDGPMMLIGGTNDTTTPTSSFLKVWDAIQANEIGGILAELIGGTHNDDAWAPEGENPALYDFGCYQDVTELWWKTFLIDSGTLDDFVDSLDPECEWTYESTGGFDL